MDNANISKEEVTNGGENNKYVIAHILQLLKKISSSLATLVITKFLYNCNTCTFIMIYNLCIYAYIYMTVYFSDIQ